MTHRITFYIEADQDICAFREVCKITRDAVDGDNFSFWRRRFLSVFEQPFGYEDNKSYRDGYQKRRQMLKLGAEFKRGHTRPEKDCLEILKDLILGKSMLFLLPAR